MKIEKLIITGLDKVDNPLRAMTRSGAIAQNYANRKGIIADRVTINWESNAEAIAWSDHRKKLTYSFDD